MAARFRSRAAPYRDAAGKEQTAFAEVEVIVAAGALVTPQLLMLSASGRVHHGRAEAVRSGASVPSPVYGPAAMNTISRPSPNLPGSRMSINPFGFGGLR
jgi:hypothetical protein